MTLPLIIVAALADNRVIGDDNRLIWRLKSDLKRFRQITLGTPMVMGRKTFLSIGKPLPGRETIVLTRDAAFETEGVHVAHSLEAALALAQQVGAKMGAAHVTIAGGADVYAQTLPLVTQLCLTLVHAKPQGDALFPDFNRAHFTETVRVMHSAGPDDEHPFTFVDLERRQNAIGR
ncbi:MAG: dihydrofolate reductase [Bosea sp. (in: a-proteobacteria)]